MRQTSEPDSKQMTIAFPSALRTLLIDELSQAGLWIKRSRVDLIQGDQCARGSLFVDETLPSVLGDADFAYLHSERAFDRAPNVLRKRLSRTAGFAWEFGSGLHRWSRALRPTRADASRLCAAFFIGTSLFDMVCDNGEKGGRDLLQIFDRAMLRAICERPAHTLHVLAQSASWHIAEHRILFKLIAAFFERVSALTSRPDHVIFDLIERAYVSQAATVGTLAATSVEHKILPFPVMARLVHLCGDGDYADDAGAALGRLISKIDDIADLDADLLSGSANAIGARLGSTGYRDLVREICDDLRDALDLLATRHVRMDGSWTFEEWLLAGVRSWLERPQAT
jgi:hypothetical protein